MTTASPIDRKLYGDLADDVVLLRSDGRIVARHKGGFRVDSKPEIFDAAQIRVMAATLRNRRDAARWAPSTTKAGHEITKTGEGTPLGEGAGTPAMHTDRAGSALAKFTCAKCGGPRSKWSVSLCRDCYVPTGWPGNPKPEARNPFEKSCGGGESRPAPDGSIFSRASITQTPSPGQTEGAAGCDLESGGAATGANPPTVEPHASRGVQKKAGDGGAWMQAGVAPGPQDNSAKDTLLRAGAKVAAAAQRQKGEQRTAMEGTARLLLDAHAKPKPSKVARDGNVTALWAAVDALTSASERHEKAIGELRALLSAEGLR